MNNDPAKHEKELPHISASDDQPAEKPALHDKQPDDQASSTQPQKSRSKRPRRWLKVLLLVVIFGSGIVVGSGLTVLGFVYHMRTQMSDPAQRAATWTNRLARRLDLTTEQSAVVLPVMTQSSERFEAIRRELIPQINAELDRMQREVSSVLPADKVAKWESQFKTLRNRWLPLHPQFESTSPTER